MIIGLTVSSRPYTSKELATTSYSLVLVYSFSKNRLRSYVRWSWTLFSIVNPGIYTLKTLFYLNEVFCTQLSWRACHNNSWEMCYFHACISHCYRAACWLVCFELCEFISWYLTRFLILQVPIRSIPLGLWDFGCSRPDGRVLFSLMYICICYGLLSNSFINVYLHLLWITFKQLLLLL